VEIGRDQRASGESPLASPCLVRSFFELFQMDEVAAHLLGTEFIQEAEHAIEKHARRNTEDADLFEWAGYPWRAMTCRNVAGSRIVKSG